MPEREYNIKKRWEICEKCGIFDPYDKICNHELYINPKTNKVSTEPHKGYIQGCGCFLKYKIPNRDKTCVAGKW